MGAGAVGLHQVIPHPPPELRVPLHLVSEHPGAALDQAHPGLQKDHQARIVVFGGRLYTNKHLTHHRGCLVLHSPSVRCLPGSEYLHHIVDGNEADRGEGPRGGAEAVHQEREAGGHSEYDDDY